jgi:hypothetical protein
MRVFKYLIGIWAAIAVYTVFSLAAGPRGISAYNYLLSERQLQWDNLRSLGNINEELERTRINLLYDQDTQLVHARQMGYGFPDERFIRIVGLSGSNNAFTSIGSVYSAQYPDYIPDRNIKIAAFLIGMMFFSFFLMMEIIEKRTR